MTQASTRSPQRPSLEELQGEHPQAWTAVHQELQWLQACGSAEELVAAMTIATRAPRIKRARTQQEARDQQRSAVSHEMRRLALERMRFSLATGVSEGKVRFNKINGWLLQGLLFEQGLRRKPVSMRRFNATWPLARQRRFLMPLVQKQGIYCFYSRELIEGLASIIGTTARCLEIGAGDGTLTRFLAATGIKIAATDNYSWEDRVHFDQHVIRQDASVSLRVHQPEIVVCSWPPADNNFERDVFKTRSVQTYIVITTRVEAAAGNWSSYRRQTQFTWREHADLSRLVLPPETQPVVLVFTRTTRNP